MHGGSHDFSGRKFRRHNADVYIITKCHAVLIVAYPSSLGTSTVNCNTAPQEEYDEYCYIYCLIYNNVIHDGLAYDGDSKFLYSDVCTSRNTFEKNIMYGSGSLALQHHCGKHNMGVNNVVHKTDTGTLQYMYGGCNQRGSPQEYENFHNIYLLDDMHNFQFGRSVDRYYDMPPNFHHNIYWSLVAGDEAKQAFPDSKNWCEWQTSGNDSDSLWQNPLFEDPATHNYVLMENSPAWELGIEQIEMENVGILKNGKYLLITP